MSISEGPQYRTAEQVANSFRTHAKNAFDVENKEAYFFTASQVLLDTASDPALHARILPGEIAIFFDEALATSKNPTQSKYAAAALLEAISGNLYLQSELNVDSVLKLFEQAIRDDTFIIYGGMLEYCQDNPRFLEPLRQAAQKSFHEAIERQNYSVATYLISYLSERERFADLISSRDVVKAYRHALDNGYHNMAFNILDTTRVFDHLRHDFCEEDFTYGVRSSLKAQWFMTARNIYFHPGENAVPNLSKQELAVLEPYL